MITTRISRSQDSSPINKLVVCIGTDYVLEHSAQKGQLTIKHAGVTVVLDITESEIELTTGATYTTEYRAKTLKIMVKLPMGLEPAALMALGALQVARMVRDIEPPSDTLIGTFEQRRSLLEASHRPEHEIGVSLYDLYPPQWGMQG